MLDEVDRAIRRSARLEGAFVVPRRTINQFNPDDEGRLDDVNRAEARTRGLKFYTSLRLSVLDKVYEDKQKRAVALRYASNSLTPGEARLANWLHASRRAGGAA